MPARAPVPDVRTRHVLSRLSWGVTPELVADAGGDAAGWVERQLRPEEVEETRLPPLATWFPELYRSVEEQAALYLRRRETANDVRAALARATLVRRVTTERQLLETMVDFWSNHLNVPVACSHTWFYRPAYDEAIRTVALGTFEQVLATAVLHPAMHVYLDADLAWVDRTRSPERQELNENLGRELLELHTVGRGSYTETDVEQVALLLTGFWIDRNRTWRTAYVPERHHVGPLSVLGWSHPNADPDGRPALLSLLRYLATHPVTARRVVTKLLTRLVADVPPARMVDDLVAVWLATDGDTRALLRAVVAHPDFYAHVGAKVRTPVEDLVATYRVLGVQILQPQGATSDAGVAIQSQSVRVGQLPYGWPRPDGYPDSGAAWSSTSRMFGSFKIHFEMASGIYPRTRVVYRDQESWLPGTRFRLDQLADHLSRTLLARPADRALVRTVALACDLGERELLTPDHPLVRYRRVRFAMAAVLDTPDHMTR